MVESQGNVGPSPLSRDLRKLGNCVFEIAHRESYARDHDLSSAAECGECLHLRCGPRGLEGAKDAIEFVNSPLPRKIIIEALCAAFKWRAWNRLRRTRALVCPSKARIQSCE